MDAKHNDGGNVRNGENRHTKLIDN